MTKKILQVFLDESLKLDEARARTAFDFWIKQKAAENRAVKKEIAARERAHREAMKKLDREIAAMDRAAAKKTTLKLQQSEIWNKVQTVIGNSFPDGDPIDHLIPWMNKTGVTMDQINAAVKKYEKTDFHGYLADMWDQLQLDAVYDAEQMINQHKKVEDNNPFYYFDGEKIVKNSNPWK